MSPPATRTVVGAFVIGLLPLAAVPLDEDFFLIGLILGAFVEPLLALILLCNKPNRSMGLGLLLASGICWLYLGALCGGLIK